MSGPQVEQTGEPREAATALNPMQRAQVGQAIAGVLRDFGWERLYDDDRAMTALVDLVAALVAAAGREGEERGAAKERERRAEQVVVEHGALARAAALAVDSDRWMDATEVEHHAGGRKIITFADGMQLITHTLGGSS